MQIALGVLILLFLLFLVYLVPLGLYFTAKSAGAYVSLPTLIGMRLRRVSPSRIVLPYIKLVKASLPIHLTQLEAHYLVTRNVDVIVNVYLLAKDSNMQVTFEEIAAIDLMGHDVKKVVQDCIKRRDKKLPAVI